MLKRFLFAAVAAAVCSSTAFAQSEVVFDNVEGLVVDSVLVSDANGFVPATALDDVTFADDTLVDGIQFSGNFQQSPIGGDTIIADADLDFTINIFGSDISAGPVASFDVGANVNRVSAPNPNLVDDPVISDAFDFSAPIDFLFTGGETFFVNILHAGEGSNGDFFNVGINLGDSPDGNALATFDTAGFGGLVPQTSAIDFQLTSQAIPEPSSAVLLALGFAGFVARRRR